MARRRSSSQTTGTGLLGLVFILVMAAGMLLFEASTGNGIISMSYALTVCAVVAVIIAAVIVGAVVHAGRSKTRYTQIGGPVLSWQAAEQMAANHMRAYGFSDARTTPAGADGGIDVVSRWGVAQVKYFSKPVGRPEVQKLRGAAHGRDRVLFYALTGFNPNAVQFANECGIALFQFDQRGMVWPVNALAKAYKKPEPTTV